MTIVITGAASRTSIGLTAPAITAAVRAGISRVTLSEELDDAEGNPISESRLRWPVDEEEEGEGPGSQLVGDGSDERLRDGFAAVGGAEDGEEEDENGEDDDLEGDGGDEDADELDVEELDAGERVALAARECLSDLLASHLKQRGDALAGRPCHFLLGVAVTSRPGPRYEGARRETVEQLLAAWPEGLPRPDIEIVASGNASGVRAMEIASEIIQRNPRAVCIVGAIDSLLGQETLAWLEQFERLRSETFGRNHGIAPGEAVGFLVLEGRRAAVSSGGCILATVAGVGLATEPAPFLSETPGRADGLSAAFRRAMARAQCLPAEISLVVGDLDGEHHRSKEWALVEARCFEAVHPKRRLWHPAELIGSIGAASGVVFAAIAAEALSRGWSPDGPA